MLPGETIRSGASPFCDECGEYLKFRVLRSGAGWYVGTMCCVGPYTRESGYYGNREECERALEEGTVQWRA